jgi:hypothetical protein
VANQAAGRNDFIDGDAAQRGAEFAIRDDARARNMAPMRRCEDYC